MIGKYGLEKRNDREQMLVYFCIKRQLIVTNTWFQQEKKRRYTWEKSGDTERGRYQIDYILVKHRYRNSVKCCKSYPGADAFTDHNLVAMQMSVKVKILQREKKKQKWNVERLKKNCEQFQRSIEETVKANRGMNVNQRWTELRRVIQSSARKYVGYEGKRRPKKPRITEEMINKMDERRKWKN